MTSGEIATIHIGPANQGKWTVPVTYGELHRTPIATAHKDFIVKGLDGEWFYSRSAWWRNTDGSFISATKWENHLNAMKAHPYVVVTDSAWTTADDGKPKAKRLGYICLYRIDNLIVDHSGIHYRLVERINVKAA